MDHGDGEGGGVIICTSTPFFREFLPKRSVLRVITSFMRSKIQEALVCIMAIFSRNESARRFLDDTQKSPPLSPPT